MSQTRQWLLSFAALLIWLTTEARGHIAGGAEVRLVGGPDTVPNAGRVEIWDTVSSGWITVCDDDWGFEDAQVVCRELGYPGTALKKVGSYYGDGTLGNSSAGSYDCYGTEVSLSRCRNSTAASCGLGKAAGVICTAPGYVDCFKAGGGNAGDIFSMRSMDLNTPTIEMCLNVAKRQDPSQYNGRTPLYAGLRNGDECWFNLKKMNFESDRRRNSECDLPCSGDGDQICGKNNRLSIYDVSLSYCNDLDPLPGGGRTIRPHHDAGDQFYFGTIVNFTCGAGFQLQGAPSIQCIMGPRYGVVWSAPVPLCSATSEITSSAIATASSQTPTGSHGDTTEITSSAVATASNQSPTGSPLRTDGDTTLSSPTTQPDVTAKTKLPNMQKCQSNIGASVGIGFAVALVTLILAVAIGVCYWKMRRGVEKSPVGELALQEAGGKPHPPTNRYEERINTPTTTPLEMDNIKDKKPKDMPEREDGEANVTYETIPNDVTVTQSDDVGWEDNTLYGKNQVYLEVT